MSGDLATMSFVELLQWCGNGRKSGTLEVGRQEVRKKLYCDRGQIVAAASDDPREYLGQVLLSHGRLSEEQLRAAFEAQRREGALLGRVLVTQGILSEAQVREMLQHKIMETVFSIFLWREGWFRFEEETLRNQDLRVHLEMSTEYCILSGSRRVDDWRRFRAVFPSDRMIVAPGPTPLPQAERSGPAGRLLEMARRGRTIEEMALELHAPVFTLLSQLFPLQQAGHVRPSGSLKPAAPAAKEAAGAFRTEEEEKEWLYGRAVPPGGVPVLLQGLDDLEGADLSPVEAFLLTRINGIWDVRTLVLVSPIRELETLRALKRFLDRGIIVIPET